MSDFLYYWQRFAPDTATGAIHKLNQNSPVLSEIKVGDDLWAFGLVERARYALLARMTVCKVGENPAGSPDDREYGRFFIRSSPTLTNYFPIAQSDVESLVRSLSIKCDALALGQSFQGWAAVRKLTQEDRQKLIAFAAAI